MGGLIDLGEQVEDRRLTGTVRADEAGDLGAADGHIEVVDRFQTAERDAEVDALEHRGFARVALGQQRRFTRNGDELGFLLLRHILSHGQSSFSAAARRWGKSLPKNALACGLLVVSMTKISTIA